MQKQPPQPLPNARAPQPFLATVSGSLQPLATWRLALFLWRFTPQRTVYVACTPSARLVTAASATRGRAPALVVASDSEEKAEASTSSFPSKESVMKTVLSLAALALTVACTDTAPTASLGAINTDANFSLVATRKADGSVQGEWSDQFGQGQGGVHVDVNCLVVAGNQAWIGGIIRQGSTGQGGVDLSGLAALTRVADLGKSANDAPDAISFTFIGLAV